MLIVNHVEIARRSRRLLLHVASLQSFDVLSGELLSVPQTVSKSYHNLCVHVSVCVHTHTHTHTHSCSLYLSGLLTNSQLNEGNQSRLEFLL